MKSCRRVGWKAGVAAASIAASTGAAAHAYLQRSEPPASAVLAQPPAELRLRFSEPVEPAFIELRMLRDGQPLPEPPTPRLADDGKTVHLALPRATLGTGDYEVQWRIVAKDGHPTQGRFTFRVGARP